MSLESEVRDGTFVPLELEQEIEVLEKGCWRIAYVWQIFLQPNAHQNGFVAATVDGADFSLLHGSVNQTWRLPRGPSGCSIIVGKRDGLAQFPYIEHPQVVKQPARPLIYIAGPFRADTCWTIEQNIRRAEEHGLTVAKLGGIPVIPHTMYRYYQESLPDAFWLEAGLALLRTCAAVAVCGERGEFWQSVGTAGELGEAARLGIPAFYKGGETYLESWIKEHSK